MGRFINPFTDVGFKRIFGQEVNKPLLISFLNSLFAGKKVITDIHFLNKEMLGCVLYERYGRAFHRGDAKPESQEL